MSFSTNVDDFRKESSFLKDDWARIMESQESGKDFLYTGKQPVTGQRTVTIVTGPSGAMYYLSGMIAEVGELPTFDQWVLTSYWTPGQSRCEQCVAEALDPYEHLMPNYKIFYPANCSQTNCFTCKLRNGEPFMTLETIKNRCISHLGTIDGQQLTGYAYLNGRFSEYNDLPFVDGRIYKIGYKADDYKNFVWCVAYIQEADLELQKLPQAFLDEARNIQLDSKNDFNWKVGSGSIETPKK